jgi:murein DD-endopeptidase MepM/ murein hydrolase activator NlpD
MLMMGGLMKYPKMLIVAALLVLLASCGNNPSTQINNQVHHDFEAETTPPPWIQPKVETRVSATTWKLPWESGQTYSVTQGYFGGFSHSNVRAIDFAIPSGTNIRAVRAGQVTIAENGRLNTYPNDCYSNLANGNYVTIQHDDGTRSLYLHLSQSLAVVGTRVEQGALIGYSGNTGCSTGAHLHFQAYANGSSVTIETPFYEVGGDGIPQAGYSYTSQNDGPQPQCPSSYPSPPNNRAPGGGDEASAIIVTSPTLPISWSCVNGATSYGVYISKYPYGAANLVVDQDYVSGTSYTIPASALQAGVSYRWNMISFQNANYDSSQFSSTLYFKYQPVEVDQISPNISMTSPTNNAVFTSSSINVVGSATDNKAVSSVQYQLNGGVLQNVALSGTSFSFPVTLNPGSNTISITARDVAGNNAADSRTVTYQTAPVWTPSVSSLTLSAGTVGGTTSSGTFSLQNTGTASGTYSLATSSAFMVNPATGTLANGSSATITVTAPACTVAGTQTSVFSIAGSTNTVSVSRVCTVPLLPIPAVPTGITLNVSSNGRIFASWNESTGTDQYEFTGTFDTNALVFGSPVNARGSGASGAVLVWGLTPEDPAKQGKQLCVQIRAKNTGGSSNYATSVCTTYKYYTGVSLKSSSPVVTISLP